jgi:predicted Zn-dependent protease
MGKRFICLLSFLLFIFSCQTVPITGRQQLSLIPSENILSMSFQSYNKYLSKNTVITSTEDARMVKRAGQRIQKAVEQYLSDHNMSSSLKGYNWEFNLIADKSVNAWCMPGGKVAVYTGILPVARNEAGIAVVMGHEISHAVARHGDERMSQVLITQMGGMLLADAVSQKPKETADLFMGIYGIGTQVGILLPYSRVHESEADRMGLIFMAMAGYDPHEAVDFWQRMSKAKQGASTPEFLSTHPADMTRIRNIEQLIPEAMTYYKKQ